MPLFGRATHIVTPAGTPAPTVTPIAPVDTPVAVTHYDYSYTLHTLRNLVVIGAVVLAGWWLVSTWRDHSVYTDCTNDLCKLGAKANIAKDTGVNVDSGGNISFPPKVQTTITQATPVIVQSQVPAPMIIVPPAPAPTVVTAPVPCGKCVKQIPPERAAACARLGNGFHMEIAPDGVNLYCLNPSGQRVRPDGTLVASY